MTRYFFHLCDGKDLVLDPDGLELDGVEAVAAQALVEARSILSDEVRQGYLGFHQRLEVTDEAGAKVHVLHFADAVDILTEANS